MDEMPKTVVVTGASGDIGFAVVNQLIGQGYHVAACAHKNLDRLSVLGKDKKNIIIYHLNLEDDQGIKDCARQICGDAEAIVGLVNCAGIAEGGLFGMTKIEDMRRLFQINLFGILLFTQVIVKKMMRRKCGSIVNVGSTAGIFSDPGTLAYGSSKAALIHASRALAVELGPMGIRVNAVAPAVVNSKMADMMDTSSRTKLDERGSLSGVTEPQDIADMVMFLLSDKAASISAQTIRIDRGMPF